jgi:DNA-binding NarL/FixJ family response regulator
MNQELLMNQEFGSLTHRPRDCEDPLTMTEPHGPRPSTPEDGGCRVVVVDDHELFRHGLTSMLRERGVRVVAAAGSAEEALETLERLDPHPDVMLMDLGLPGMSGVEAIRRLETTHPHIPVVVLSVMAEEDDLMAAILAGASGYVLKSASIDEVVASLHAASEGSAVVAPELAGKLLGRIRRSRQASPDPASALSEREREVLDLMSEGYNNAEIAARLYISQNTVKNHVAAILEKLGADNRVQAVVRAVRSRIP